MRIDFVITIVILVWWYLFSISRVFRLSSCESFSLLSRNTASTLILSSFSNIPCHLKDGASCNSVISDRKNIQCRFVPPIFICAQPNVATTDNSRAIMLMYYGRLFIKVACYLLEKKKKNSLRNKQLHHEKMFDTNVLHKSFTCWNWIFLKKKKKKIIKTIRGL